MDRSVDRYWGIYLIQTRLETHLAVHQLGFKAMIFKIAILRAFNAGFPGCLSQKSHTERFGKSRATNVRMPKSKLNSVALNIAWGILEIHLTSGS